jgi:hypothetical protein
MCIPLCSRKTWGYFSHSWKVSNAYKAWRWSRKRKLKKRCLNVSKFVPCLSVIIFVVIWLWNRYNKNVGKTVQSYFIITKVVYSVYLIF